MCISIGTEPLNITLSRRTEAFRICAEMCCNKPFVYIQAIRVRLFACIGTKDYFYVCCLLFHKQMVSERKRVCLCPLQDDVLERNR